ncbi:hypothetical protein [Pseudobacillus sp. 179-B 2D1 NHS]|uniref:hypothetical protein n=2 Tax=unclassified Pseudobacillus TaxID=2619284 RepID=UPI0038790344
MMKKSLYLLMVSIFLLFLSGNQSEVYASFNEGNVLVKSDVINVSQSELSESGNKEFKRLASLPNAVTINVTPSVTGVTVKVRNYGVDTVDSVVVTVNSPKILTSKGKEQKGKNKSTFVFTNLKPAISQDKSKPVPMVRTKMSYTGSAVIKDGKKVVTKSVNASLDFSTDQLTKEWDKGTFSDIHKSIDYHFAKHYNDKYVKVNNLQQYLNKASSARSEMKNITKTTSKYRYKKSATSIKVTKMSGKTTTQYVLLTNTKAKKLYSYGGD